MFVILIRGAVIASLLMALLAAIYWRQPPQHGAPDSGSSVLSGQAESNLPPPQYAVPVDGDGAQDVLTHENAADYAIYHQRLAFGDDIAAFLSESGSLPLTERRRRADALLGEIDALDSAGYLAPAQTAFLKASIADALDPQKDAAARKALLNSFERQVFNEDRSYAKDRRYRELKAREKEILAKAMSTEYFPGGMTRDEFISKELSDLSLEIYGETTDTPD